MTTSTTSISPLDGRYKKHTTPLDSYASEYGLIRYRVLVEIRWLMHMSNTIASLPPMTKEDIEWLNSTVNNFSKKDAEDIKARESETNHDVKAVEYWLKDLIQGRKSLAPHLEFVHFACTSEDINNLAYGLMQKDISKTLLGYINTIDNQLTELAKKHKATAMLSRTHGQAASPTTLGKEVGNFIHRLRRQKQNIYHQEIYGKINGAVGNYNAHQLCCPEVNWIEVSRTFVESLGLTWNPMTTQIEPHDTLAELSHSTIRYNNILLDMCRDIWGYISIGYFSQQTKKNEIGSSTMPHKVNPIDFENAEGNLGLANAILDHLANKLPISRWQRDLSDSTVLRNLGSAFGYCIIACASFTKGVAKLEVNEPKLAQDLADNYEVLAEPIQTVMRYHGMEKPYERLKELTRGKKVDRSLMQDFIHTLELPKDAKETLLATTPNDYIGLAERLVTDFVLEKK